MEKQLEYLNLEFREYNKRRTIDDVDIYCFNKNHGKHRFHSENTHLNTISDICFTLLKNIDCEKTYFIKNQKEFISVIQKQSQQSEIISEKLDFLKNQQPSFNSEKDSTQQILEQICLLQKKISSLELSVQKLEQYIKSI